MEINKHKIGKGNPYFVIEEGQFNLGDFKKAIKMIDIASETGADAIEFQLAIASDFYIKSHKGYELYRKREFSETQLGELIDYSNEKGLDLVVAPLSSKLINIMAKKGCAAFNINASDLVNPDMLDMVSEVGKPFFLSLLLAEEEEIEWAINRISKRKNIQFGLLLGQHTMASGGHGVDLKHTNLGFINTLKQRYGVPVGFIDHSSNIWSPACAVAAGADVITKHITTSREEKGPDWQVCLEPEEMKKSIGLVKEIHVSLSSTEKTLAPGENIDRSVMRRSIVSTRELRVGEIITRNDIAFKRPGTGISSIEFNSVIGRTVFKTIKEDQLITLDDIQ
ncbi:MAG: N-acetylneuraminate synthase family protein [Salinivirgaceae bacterium]|jgi:N,N'-diacetyllegionaminate synthase|nr:N-acetylneuraminate synthase family protein [Salinivirgaceae bacterium]